MKKLFMKLFLFSITVMLLVSLSSAAQIHLKNGVVLRGEIVSSDENSVIINEQDMGMLKLSNEKILKIVEGKEVKKEKTYSAPLELQDDYFDAYARDLRRKGLISISFSGGLSNIDGGDLNAAITGMNELYADANDLLPSYTYTADLEEFTWIQNFKGELLFNLSPYMSIAFGAEYLTKTSAGSLSSGGILTETLSGTGWYAYGVVDESSSSEVEYKLTAYSPTLSLYFFIPMGRAADFFITGGVGYYFGKAEHMDINSSQEDYEYDFYDSSDDSLYYTETGQLTSDRETILEAKCNTIGFHGGAGFSINLSPNFSLVFEGAYRYVNFTDWQGEANDYYSDIDEWTYSDEPGVVYSDSYSSSTTVEGKLWFYELNIPFLESYDTIDMSEEEPSDTLYKNVRKAEISLNGFSLRAGIKITF